MFKIDALEFFLRILTIVRPSPQHGSCETKDFVSKPDVSYSTSFSRLQEKGFFDDSDKIGNYFVGLCHFYDFDKDFWDEIFKHGGFRIYM